MPAIPRLSVIVAVKDAPQRLQALIEALLPQLRPDVELVLAVAGAAPAGVGDHVPHLRVLCASADSLVPHLWRDGLLAARGERAAFTTSAFHPPSGWIDALLGVDLGTHVAVGGPIAMSEGGAPAAWAVFFQRYSAFAPPLAGAQVDEIAADNAVYRREALLAHRDLLAHGFWEPEFHARFRAAGLSLALDPVMESTYAGGEAPGLFVRHRFSHGRTYGRDRGARGDLARKLALLAASPAVPALLLWRIARRSRRSRAYAAPLARAAPWLVVFCVAWAAGEACGYLDALTGRASRASAAPDRR